MLSGQFYEKRLSVRESNTKLLLETVTYIAIKERHPETPICIITIKIVTHMFAAEIVSYICAAETSNCMTATETVTCIIVTGRSTNIPVIESNT